MTAYKIVRGTLSHASSSTWGVLSGCVEMEWPTQWRAFLMGSDQGNITLFGNECTLNVDLEGGGELHGNCSVVERNAERIKVECAGPVDFVEPVDYEAD